MLAWLKKTYGLLSAARHNPAAVAQPARLINTFCINLMNSQHQFVYPLDENPPTAALEHLLPNWEEKCNNCAGQGETHLLLAASQACRPHLASFFVPCWYSSRSKNTLLFHRAAWSLAVANTSRPPSRRRGFIWKSLSGIKILPNQVQEQELLMAILLHLVTNAALREVH